MIPQRTDPQRPDIEQTWLFLVATLTFLVVLLGGCERQPPAISVGIDQSGQAVRMQAGQELAVSLPSNPSTGYHWEIETIDSAILQQAGEPDYQPAPGTARPGQGGSVTFRFLAVAGGKTPLRLFYLPPTGESTPAEIFFLVVIVE